jgi:hypothetical protein
MENAGSDPCCFAHSITAVLTPRPVVIGVGEEKHGRHDPEPTRLRPRVFEQPPVRERL